MKMETTYKMENVHQFLTQQEVADIFRVTANTVKNWRNAGLLDYFQVPSSTRVLYPVQSVNQFREQYCKKAAVNPIKKTKEIRILEGHNVASDRIKNEWRLEE